jgi:hypothetical protein
MNKLKILIILLAAFTISCSSEFKDKQIEIVISQVKKLDTTDFSFIKGENKNNKYFRVKVDIINHSDTAFGYVSMNCTWQENWISNKNNFLLLPETHCIHNSPDLYVIEPKKKKTLYSVLIVDESIGDFNNQNSKLGMVLVRLNEIPANVNFKDVLRSKLEQKKDIIWSNPIYLKE